MKINNLFESFPQIKLNNYLLRELSEDDLNDIYEIYSDDETVKYEGIEPFNTKEQAKEFIQSILNGYKNKYFIRWGVEDKQSRKLIGLVALYHIDYKNRNAQIGYILNKDYWEKGIMSTVLNDFVRFMFLNTDLYRLEVLIHPYNERSIKLASKTGFEFEGLKKQSAFNSATKCFEDRIIMGLIKE